MYLSIQERCTKVNQDYKHWTNDKKNKIDDSLIDKIKSFWIESSNWTLTIESIKWGVLQILHDAQTFSNLTINNILKMFNKIFKVLYSYHSKTRKPEQKEVYNEFLMIECILRVWAHLHRLILLSSRKPKLRGWNFTHKAHRIETLAEGFTMYLF